MCLVPLFPSVGVRVGGGSVQIAESLLAQVQTIDVKQPPTPEAAENATRLQPCLSAVNDVLSAANVCSGGIQK